MSGGRLAGELAPEATQDEVMTLAVSRLSDATTTDTSTDTTDTANASTTSSDTAGRTGTDTAEKENQQ